MVTLNLLLTNRLIVLDDLDIEIGGEGYNLAKSVGRQALAAEILGMIDRAVANMTPPVPAPPETPVSNGQYAEALARCTGSVACTVTNDRGAEVKTAHYSRPKPGQSEYNGRGTGYRQSNAAAWKLDHELADDRA